MPAGQADRNMGVDAVVEAEPMDQPVGGGEVDAALPDSIERRREACMNVQGAWFPFLTPRSKYKEIRARKTKLSTIDAYFLYRGDPTGSPHASHHPSGRADRPCRYRPGRPGRPDSDPGHYRGPVAPWRQGGRGRRRTRTRHQPGASARGRPPAGAAGIAGGEPAPRLFRAQA